MAKTYTYTILALGGTLTTMVQSDIYRYAVVVSLKKWSKISMHRDMRSAMEHARGLMDEGTRTKVVEAVLTAIDGEPIPGAVEKRLEEKVNRLKANSDRVFQRSFMKGMDEEHREALYGDFKAYERWIDEIKAQIKAV